MLIMMGKGKTLFEKRSFFLGIDQIAFDLGWCNLMIISNESMDPKEFDDPSYSMIPAIR